MSASPYEQYLVRKPIHEIGVQAVGIHKGHQVPSMTYMSNALVPGSNTYIEVSWIYNVPEPNPYVHEHKHNYDEIIMHIGGDNENPEDLGATIELGFNGQPLVFDTTTALFVPKGTKHGPLVWKKVTRPHIEITMMLGCGDFAKAMPGRTADE